MASEDEVRAVKRRHSAHLLGMDGVSGVGVERDDAQSYVLAIHFDDQAAADRLQIPATLDGVPVRTIISGRYRKQD
jgi:hypothetical protein